MNAYNTCPVILPWANIYMYLWWGRPTGAVQVYGLSKARGGPVLLLVGMVVLYVLCLLCSLLMAPQDVLIYNKNDEEGEDWPRLALQDAGFRDGLDTWKSLAAVRLASALGAWLIVCILTWSNLAVSLRLIDLVVRLRQMVVRRKNRICELEGDGDVLSELPESRLRELIETQRVWVARAIVYGIVLCNVILYSVCAGGAAAVGGGAEGPGGVHRVRRSAPSLPPGSVNEIGHLYIFNHFYTNICDF